MNKFFIKPLVAAIALATASTAGAQSEEIHTEEVVIKGFRKSVEAAINVKRNATNNVDAIVAEDIGKMPDLNLAESIQRVPGVAISRQGGEGRQISVRGLGPQYTRVTLNGMEVPASAAGLDSAGGVNRGRSFDFNIFSADLFRQINLNKTNLASIEEGGLASTVDLLTLRPMDQDGFNANVSVQTSLNQHTGEIDPRLTGMISNNLDDKFGVLVGINYADRTAHQDGFGTVRWTGPASNLQGDAPAGWGWGTNTANISGSMEPGANYSSATMSGIQTEVDAWNAQTPAERLLLEDLDGDGNSDDNRWGLDPTDAQDSALAGQDATFGGLDYMWAPRLPRTDSFNLDQTRTGLLLGLQGKPNDRLELNLNVMTSEREADVISYNYFAQMRNLHNSLTPTDVTIDPTGRYILAGTFEGVLPRSETRAQIQNTDFTQVVASAKYDFSDDLRLDVLLGTADSEFTRETYRYDLTALTPQTFNYSFEANANVAEFGYPGFDLLNPSEYEATRLSHGLDTVNRENETFKVDLTWDIDDDGSNVKAGVITNGRTIDSGNWGQDPDDPIPFTPGNAPINEGNTNNLSQENGDFGEGISAPSGFLRDWIVLDINTFVEQANGGHWALNPDSSSTYVVSEDTLGAYVEGTYNTGPWMLNGGFRWVETTVDGNKSPVGEKSYTNTLPALNLSYSVNDDLVLRASYSENLSRPNPANLSGEFSFNALSGSASIRNPDLNPELAEALDIGVEWYFAEESYVGLVIFSKDITDSIFTETVLTTLDEDLQSYIAGEPEYDPNSPEYEVSGVAVDGQWSLTRRSNSSEVVEVDGYELSFNYLTEIGVGIMANYTSLDDNDGQIEDLSETSYNLGVFYENDTFAGRIVVNSRDDYITSFTGGNGNLQYATTGPTRFDFSGSYNFNEMIDFTLEIINLTNEKERLYTTGPTGDQNYVREWNSTGTELIFGVRATF